MFRVVEGDKTTHQKYYLRRWICTRVDYKIFDAQSTRKIKRSAPTDPPFKILSTGSVAKTGCIKSANGHVTLHLCTVGRRT
jgi:hypothetical protein